MPSLSNLAGMINTIEFSSQPAHSLFKTKIVAISHVSGDHTCSLPLVLYTIRSISAALSSPVFVNAFLPGEERGLIFLNSGW